MKKVIDIEGMSCQHCVQSVEKELAQVHGVLKVKVNLAKKNAVVTTDSSVNDTVLIKAVENAGFTTSAVAEKKGLF